MLTLIAVVANRARKEVGSCRVKGLAVRPLLYRIPADGRQVSAAVCCSRGGDVMGGSHGPGPGYLCENRDEGQITWNGE